jgi:hypothetical protein
MNSKIVITLVYLLYQKQMYAHRHKYLNSFLLSKHLSQFFVSCLPFSSFFLVHFIPKEQASPCSVNTALTPTAFPLSHRLLDLHRTIFLFFFSEILLICLHVYSLALCTTSSPRSSCVPPSHLYHHLHRRRICIQLSSSTPFNSLFNSSFFSDKRKRHGILL